VNTTNKLSGMLVEEEPEAPQPVPAPVLTEETEPEPGEEGAVPSWAAAAIPQDLKVPKGREVAFLRFKSAWCDSRFREKGIPTTYRRRRDPNSPWETYEELSRVLVIWPLNLGEERLAMKRARDPSDTPGELAKQMIRAVDGRRIDWTGEWGKRDNGETLESPDRIWEELGPKCRPLVIAQYRQLHTLSTPELANFLVDCIVVTRPAGG